MGLCLVLVGCATPSYKTVEVTKVEVHTVQIPKELLKLCLPIKPINENDYLTLTQPEREAYLTHYVIVLLSILKDCNTQITEIDKLNQKQVSQHEDQH